MNQSVDRVWTVIPALGFAALGLSLAACHGHSTAEPPPALVVAAPVHPLRGSQAGETLRYPVEVAARYSNAMSFRVAGKLIERTVRLGDAVRKGQIIARLDPIDAQKAATGAQAVAEAAEHRLGFARQQLERDVAQSADNLIAASQLEQAQDTYAAALAARTQAAAQLVIASNALAYTTLTADHEGIITSENADTGQLVAAGQTIYGLAWAGDTDVTLDAAASDVGRIKIGQVATVTFPGVSGPGFDARVREIAPAADPQSRTYRIKLTLSAPGPAVRLGMTGDALFVSMPVQGAQPASLFDVPATAVFHQGDSPAVWILRPADSVLELRPVTVSHYGERSVTVTSGLLDGDTVVIAGVHTVYAGQHVTPTKPMFADQSMDSP